MTAAMALGALLGALFGGYYVDKIGRLRMFLLDLVFFVVSAVGAAFSTGYGMLIAFRLLMGVGVGLDFPVALPGSLANALRDTGANSYQLELRLPWMMAGDFAPRFSVNLALKDLRLAVDMAARWRAPTPLGAGGLQTFSAAAARDLGDQDAAAVFRLFFPG